MPDASPLMSEAEAMAWLGTDKKGLQKHIRNNRLHWHTGTRTFARKEVMRLAEAIEKEILPNDGTEMGQLGEEVDSFDGFRIKPALG